MAEDDAASYVSLGPSTFRREVAAGRLPKPIRLTTSRVAWLREDLDAWLDRCAGRIPSSEPSQTELERRAWEILEQDGRGGSSLPR